MQKELSQYSSIKMFLNWW